MDRSPCVAKMRDPRERSEGLWSWRQASDLRRVHVVEIPQSDSNNKSRAAAER
jgi:hypothetical protein